MLYYFHKNLVNIISMIGLVFTALFVMYCYKNGIFSSQSNITKFISSYGIAAPLVFLVLQAIQVIIPIIPAGITSGFAVMFWGGIGGFILNYIGICGGSILAFLIARKYGKSFVKSLFGSDKFNKYVDKFNLNNNFEKVFALLIFLPLAPDDFLCYFAGLTDLTLNRFIVIILIGKISGIIFYSLFLLQIFRYFGFAC